MRRGNRAPGTNAETGPITFFCLVRQYIRYTVVLRHFQSSATLICSMVLQANPISTQMLSFFALLTTRCGMCKHPCAARSEVTLQYNLQRQFTHSDITWISTGNPSSKFSSNHQHCLCRAMCLFLRHWNASLQSYSCARESVIHGYSSILYVQIISRSHRCTHIHIRQHVQVHLSPKFWILFLTLLLSVLPNPCNCGA